MFNPRTGRWLSPDPHWDIRTNAIFGDSPTMRNGRYIPNVHAILQSGNLYLFTMHNPVNFTDPSGLFAIPIHAVFNPIAKAAKKLVAKLTNKPAVQNTAQQASQTVQQTQQVSQAARGSVPAAQQVATPITRYAPQVAQAAQQVAPAVQQVFKLSKNKIHHITTRHVASTFAHQAARMSDTDLATRLSKKSFFNPSLTQEQVVNIVEQGVNTLKNQGITTGEHIITVTGERIFIALENGVFKTAYGMHELTPAFFGR